MRKARTVFSRPVHGLLIAGLLLGCLLPGAVLAEADFTVTGDQGTTLAAAPIASFDEPWALSFLPDDRLLVTEQAGRLWLVTPAGEKTEVDGVPDVVYGGQGGFGDIVLAPDFATSRRVYLSYVDTEDGGQTRGAVVSHARLDESGDTPRLAGLTEVWRQTPFVSGNGHFSHRIVFGPANSPQAGYMFIASGDRQKLTPAQSLDNNLGTIIRLHPDGRVPEDNPFVARGGVAAQVWSYGHRNVLGMDFDVDDQLWVSEMGPRHGDELNRVERGANYGWPEVSEGSHYSGESIPPHSDRPDFRAPAVAWVPSIAPAGMTIYDGQQFAGWRNDALVAGLVARAIVRVDLSGQTPEEIERYGWDHRVRDIATGPDGALWVIEDGDGRLLRLTPKDA